MRSSSRILLSVFLVTFISAIPAPDKYQHFSSPGCVKIGAIACVLLPYCKYHRERGVLFSAKYLNRRDGPESGNLDFNLTDALSPSLPSFSTTTEHDILSKRTSVIACGVLSCVIKREVSNQIKSLVAGVLYDVIVDYPYNGATGGKIAIVAQVKINAVVRLVRLASARTGYGGVVLTFQAPESVAWYQMIFIGDDLATSAVVYYIRRHLSFVAADGEP